MQMKHLILTLSLILGFGTSAFKVNAEDYWGWNMDMDYPTFYQMETINECSGGYGDLVFENGFFKADKDIVFIHTGGSAALFAYETDLV